MSLDITSYIVLLISHEPLIQGQPGILHVAYRTRQECVEDGEQLRARNPDLDFTCEMIPLPK
jgi:hypothetical protein